MPAQIFEIVTKPSELFLETFFPKDSNGMVQSVPYLSDNLIILDIKYELLYDGILKYTITFDGQLKHNFMSLTPFKYNHDILSKLQISVGTNRGTGNRIDGVNFNQRTSSYMLNFLRQYGYNVVDTEYDSYNEFYYPMIEYASGQNLIKSYLYVTNDKLNFLLSELTTHDEQFQCLSYNSQLDLAFMKEIAHEFDIKVNSNCIPKEHEYDLIRYANFILSEEPIPYVIHLSDKTLDDVQKLFKRSVPELLSFEPLIQEISNGYFSVPIFFLSDLDVYRDTKQGTKQNSFVQYKTGQKTKYDEPELVLKDDVLVYVLRQDEPMEINLFSFYVPEELMIKLWTSGALFSLWDKVYYRKYKKHSSYMFKSLVDVPYTQTELITYLESLSLQ